MQALTATHCREVGVVGDTAPHLEVAVLEPKGRSAARVGDRWSGPRPVNRSRAACQNEPGPAAKVKAPAPPVSRPGSPHDLSESPEFGCVVNARMKYL